VFAGETMSRSPRFRIGIETFAAPELNVPM
jgi:hypothetical protein